MKVLWVLYSTFFKIGAFTFGGGYAMLPLLQREMVSRKWTTDEEILDYYALGQSVPGIIAINTATFIGYKIKKIPGAVAATAGMVTPSLLIIMTIAAFFMKFRDIPVVGSAFSGITAAVVALIVSSVIKMAKKSVRGWYGIILAILAFCISAFLDISPIWIILGAAAAGIAINRAGVRNK